MIRINLVFPEVIREESKNDLMIVVGIIGGLLVAVIGGLYVWETLISNRYDSYILEANANLEKYQRINAEVERLTAERSRLEQRKNVIQSLINSRLLYSVFLHDFVSLIPDKVWVQNISSRVSGPAALDLDVSAKSFSVFSIADWITAFEQSGQFQFTELGRITASPLGDKDVKVQSFTIKVKYTKKI